MKKLAKVDLFFTVVWVLILISGICFKFSAKLIGWPDFSDSAFVENRALEPKPNYQTLPARSGEEPLKDGITTILLGDMR